MYRIAQGSLHDLPDAAEFIETLNTLEENESAHARNLFDPKSEITVARAPGRLDVMGGIADYSGSLVLEMPIAEATFAAVQLDPTRVLEIVSLGGGAERQPLFEMPLSEFEEGGGIIDYDKARARFQLDPSRRWAAYIAGVFLVLMRERGIRFQNGARLLIDSQVPEGSGVSSSAALEVAVMQAVTAAYNLEVPPRELALLCQQVENLVVGAPCGVMDQITASSGEPRALLALLCQPAELCEMIPVPEEISVWGVDSGERHHVAGPDYDSVRVGAFMGYRMIGEIAGLRFHRAASQAPLEVEDSRWNGYLANVSVQEFESGYQRHLPERIIGAEFLTRFGGTTDRVTRIDPERSYAVRVPTAHPIFEHQRVKRFAQAISGAAVEERLAEMGELMYQSHASYSACGLGSPGTDRLVELVREAGPQSGLFGARITGGGSGGTVAVLGRHDAADAIAGIAEKYAADFGRAPRVFAGSSPGSAAFGHLKLTGSN